MSGGRRGGGVNENVPLDSFGQGAQQYLALRLHALPKFARKPPTMGHVFGILHPPVLRRDKWGGNRWKTLAAEETRPGSLEERNDPSQLKVKDKTKLQPIKCI